MFVAKACQALSLVFIAIRVLPGIRWATADSVSVNQTNSSSRIIGGFLALAESTRHQVSLRIKEYEDKGFGRGHICGGSLIKQQLVVTAAHCLVDDGFTFPASLFVVVGGHTERLVQTDNTFISAVSSLVVHQNYDEELFTNDIALLHLTTAVPSDHPTLQPITIAEQTPQAGAECQVTGWGTTISGVPGSAAVLMAVNITIIDTTVCNGTDSYDGEILSGMLCAGHLEGGKDSCQGDSGGPLVCDGLLAGTVSFGFQCGLQNFPGVYADVAFYNEWITTEGAAAATGTTTVESVTAPVGGGAAPRQIAGVLVLAGLLLLLTMHIQACLK